MTRRLDFITKNLKATGSCSYDNTNTPKAQYGKNYAVSQPEYNALGDVANYRQYGSNTQINPDGNFGGGDARGNTYMEAVLNWNETYGKSEITAMMLGNRRLVKENSCIPFAYQSVLFRCTYTYNTKYIGEISASYQGSENFPKGSRYGLFPSISAGWIISEESFIKNQIAIPEQPGNGGVKQWFAGISGISATVDLYARCPHWPVVTAQYGFLNKLGFGVNIYNDKASILKGTRAIGTVAYPLAMGTSGQKLSLGISAGVMNQSINTDNPEDLNDISVTRFNDRGMYLDGDIGLAYTGTKLTVQASGPNVRNFRKEYELNNLANTTTYFAAISYKPKLIYTKM